MEDYYGKLNELRNGLTVGEIVTPEILIYLEMCESNGIPLMDGGLLNQPHIFLIEASIARTKRSMFEQISGAKTNGS